MQILAVNILAVNCTFRPPPESVFTLYIVSKSAALRASLGQPRGQRSAEQPERGPRDERGRRAWVGQRREEVAEAPAMERSGMGCSS